jgi:non-specific protein-tyrosine kinase
MSKLRKALEKAKEARETEVLSNGGSLLSDAVQAVDDGDATVSDSDDNCLELDVCYSQTKVTKIDPNILMRGKIVSLFHDFEITDQIKTIRTQVIKKLEEKNGNSLMVTSANPYEGKSFTSINLGVSIAHELDKTVLLVDTDLRKPMKKHKRFDNDFFRTSFEKGLSDYLLNGTELPDLLVNPGIDRLVLLPAGKSLPNSAEYLGSPRMQMLVKEMKSRYADDRIIIFDTPSLLKSADPLVISKYVDGIILVVEENKTTTEQIKKAIELLEDRPILGTVMNKVK